MTTVSTAAFYDSAIFSMNSLRSQANDLQAQISTGNRLNSSADDPVAAAKMRSLARADTLSQIDTTNADAAKSALADAEPLMMRAAQKGIVHKNNASRKISRLTVRVKALAQ